MKSLGPSQAVKVRLFVAIIESVDVLCNQPNELFMDKDGVYPSLPE